MKFFWIIGGMHIIDEIFMGICQEA